MKLVFPRNVREEASAAITYYEAERAGLGDQLWRELLTVVRWVEANPKGPRVRTGDYRRVNLRTFPYYIAYAIRGDNVVLLAVAHVARRPEYWRNP